MPAVCEFQSNLEIKPTYFYNYLTARNNRNLKHPNKDFKNEFVNVLPSLRFLRFRYRSRSSDCYVKTCITFTGKIFNFGLVAKKIQNL
jgi:hypothetical protein